MTDKEKSKKQGDREGKKRMEGGRDNNEQITDTSTLIGIVAFRVFISTSINGETSNIRSWYAPRYSHRTRPRHTTFSVFPMPEVCCASHEIK